MVNQDDIDGSLQDADGDGDEGASSSPEAQPAQPEEQSSGGDVNQADIDALINGPPDEAEATPTPQPAGADAAGVSQDDIDALINGAGDEATKDGETPAVSSESTEAPANGVSQDDIDALLEGAEGDASPSSEEAPAGAPEEDVRLDSLGRPFDEAAAAMQAAIEEEQAAASAAPPPETSPLPLEQFAGGDDAKPAGAKGVSMLNDVKLKVRIELGRTRMRVEDVLALDEGSVVELNKLAGDPVDVFVNGRLLARGEVLILNDNFCVRISEVFTRDPHRVSA